MAHFPKNQSRNRGKMAKSKRISLHPLKFDEVISDVLKVKPEPKKGRPKRPREANRKATKLSKDS